MAIDISNITVQFGEKIVFLNFSLHVSLGEFVCIIGKTACGKSVLLKTILGEIQSQCGSIKINNHTACPSKTVGMVWQDFKLLPWMTLRENIALGATASEQICHNASVLQIEEFLDLLPKQVSGGTQQRTSIARVLATGADIILMDEPTSSIDAITATSVRHDLKTISNNRTVVYVTHDVNEAILLSTRIICLGENGTVLADLPNNNITGNMLLEVLRETR